MITAYVHEGRDQEKDLSERVAAVERLFRQGLEKDASMMQAALATLSRDEGMKKNFLEGDREALLKVERRLRMVTFDVRLSNTAAKSDQWFPSNRELTWL